MDRPADAACLDLLMENGFGESGARDFLKVYVSTITYAKLSDSINLRKTLMMLRKIMTTMTVTKLIFRPPRFKGEGKGEDHGR